MAEALRRALGAGPGAAAAADDPPLLLLGGPRSGKTSLLFAAALEAAGRGRGPALFLARRPLRSLPLRSPAARDARRLQKVRFQYPPSTPALLRLLCSAHEAPGPAPTLLLLDGLEEYLAEGLGPRGAARLAALLLDAAACFGRRLGPRRHCGLLVALETRAETPSGDALQPGLIRRFFPARCWLQPDAPGPGPAGLKVLLDSGSPSPREEWPVTFSASGEMKVTLPPPQALPEKKS